VTEGIPSPQRSYREQPKRGRDVDASVRVIRLRTALYAIPGGVIGAAAFFYLGFSPLLGLVVGYALTYGLTSGIVAVAGRAAGTIYHPSGKATPHIREYSRAAALAAHGRYEEAITAYEAALSEFPEDAEPYICIARIYRDRLVDYEQAAYWFKRARSDSQIESGKELMVTQELIEVYTKRLGAPTRAIPELARLIDRFPNHPAADWARRERDRLRPTLESESR